MVDYVDIQETFLVAKDFDSRKRYVMTRTGVSNDLAVCSGVTWRLGSNGLLNGHPIQDWRWRIDGIGNITFTGGVAVPAPSPQVVTSCRID